MPITISVWQDAWTALPADVHHVGEHHHVLCQAAGGGCRPYQRAPGAFFPRLFGSKGATRFNNPDLVLRPGIRRLSTTGDTTINSEDERRIRTAVRAAAPILRQIIEQYLVLEASGVTATDLNAREKKQNLLARAFDLILDGVTIADPAEARTFLLSRQPRPSLAGLTRVLADPATVAQLEQALRGAAPRPSAFGAFTDFVNHPAALARPDSSGVGPAEVADADAAWQQLVDSDLAYLATVMEPPHLAPAATITIRRPIVRDDDRPLLTRSVEERVAWTLTTRGTDTLADLDERALLLEEVQRCRQPLGVASDRARAILLAGSALTTYFHDLDEEAVDGSPLVQAVHRARRNQRQNKWCATFPALRQQTDAPTQAYLDALWIRVHGHEARGTLDAEFDTPDAVWDLLRGVIRTIFYRGVERMRVSTRHHPVLTYLRHLLRCGVSIDELQAFRSMIELAVDASSPETAAARKTWEQWCTDHPRTGRDQRPIPFKTAVAYLRST